MALEEESQGTISLHDYCNIKYRNRPRKGPRGAPWQQLNVDDERWESYPSHPMTVHLDHGFRSWTPTSISIQ
jgi:hypothetical protein